mmetsp:Transcript_13901/g.23055  ORF Transcript_13901/g.23055 Transcript_13901/m.23055 type:complete len:139 (-) Transcript_13901:1929-2345(-)
MCDNDCDYGFGPTIGYNLQCSQVPSSEVYDSMTKSCGFLQNSGRTRKGHAAAAIGDDIFLVGGFTDGNSLRLAECFNTCSSEWEILPEMINKRHHCAAVALDGKIYVLGGSDSKSAEMYDHISRSWTMLASMQNKRTR